MVVVPWVSRSVCMYVPYIMQGGLAVSKIAARRFTRAPSLLPLPSQVFSSLPVSALLPFSKAEVPNLMPPSN